MCLNVTNALSLDVWKYPFKIYTVYVFEYMYLDQFTGLYQYLRCNLASYIMCLNHA